MNEIRVEDMNAKQPEPGEYWRRKDDGRLVVVYKIDDEHVWYIDTLRNFENPTQEGTRWGDKHAEFADLFEFAPDGEAQRDEELRLFQQQMMRTQQQILALGSDLKLVSGGAAAPEGADSSTTALALTSDAGVQQAEEMKRNVASLRNEVAKMRKKASEEQRQVKLMLRERQEAMKAKMDAMMQSVSEQMAGLEKMLEQAQEFVWTVNLYLGKDETIRLLREGKPADKSEKIAIRQMVLYMDEESALNADEGGIDFNSMEEFDEWVMKSPKHLEQMLPNIKGVVAIKPRRKNKGYNTGNAMIDAKLEAMNKHTYFLIRNGERLYRIDTDLEVGDTLLPLKNEFAELFETRDWGETVKLKPGDPEYMKALENVGKKERHYMRVFLFLQGLLDRTKVFHPLDTVRLNVFDMNRQDEHLVFVTDAEASTLLGSGRPSFDEWLEKNRADADVGMRVIGKFKTSDYHSGGRSTARTYPAGAAAPDDEALHTIVRVERNIYGTEHLTFLYHRNETIYTRDFDQKESERRASIWFTRSDDHWICFDRAEVADMEFYMASRTNRREYGRIFPVMERAIAYKKKEEKDEKPFRTALTGALMREYGIDKEAAQQAVGELVAWWKFKNKTHRALLSDDEKASRMILKEYGLRHRRTEEREAMSEFDHIVGRIRAQAPDAVAIYHVKGKEFAVFTAMNEEDIFVREQRWRDVRGEAKLESDKEWVVTNSARMSRWDLLYAADRWSEWTHDANPKFYLSTPEREKLIALGWQHIEKHYADGNQAFRTGPKRLVKLATYLRKRKQNEDEDSGIALWYTSAAPGYPERVLTQEWGEPQLKVTVVKWDRGKKGEITARYDTSNYSWGVGPLYVERPKRDRFDDLYKHEDGILLWQDPEAIERVKAEREVWHAKEREVVPPLQKAVRAYTDQAEAHVTQLLLQRVREKFDADYGDPDLWEDHLAEQKLPKVHLYILHETVPYLIERNESPVGLTAAQVIERAVEYGYRIYGYFRSDKGYKAKDAADAIAKFNKDDRRGMNTDVLHDPPLDYVFQPVEIEPDAEEEEFEDEEFDSEAGNDEED